MRLLFVCTTCPVPPFSGAAHRELGWLRTASEFAEVALVTLTRNERQHLALADLASICAMVVGVSAPRTVPRKLRDLFMAAFSGVPYLVWSGHERRLYAAVSRIVEQWSPHVVQAELLPAAPYLEIPRLRNIPSVYAAHNVESRIVAGRSAGRWAGVEERCMRRFEARVARDADAVVTVNQIEAEWFSDHARTVHHVPNALDVGDIPFEPPSSRTGLDLLFVGHLGYGPNVDAATTLARQVFPEVRSALPGTRCVIAGAEPVRAVRALAGDGVEVVADPEDLGPQWSRAGVLVCPLRWGGGSRIKILEAVARGVPVVSTLFGAEGLEFEPGVHLCVGSGPHELAAAAASVLRDRAAFDAAARAARDAVEQHHSWQRLRSAMIELYEGLVGDYRQERGGDGS